MRIQPIDSAAELGQLIRQERKRQNLTLSEFHEFSSVTTRFMSEFERGLLSSVSRLLRVLQMLGLVMVILPKKDAQQLLQTIGQGPSDD